MGIHQPSDAGKVPAAFISVLRLWNRKSAIKATDWIMDSGAFSIILKHAGYPPEMSPSAYAERIRRFAGSGNLLAAVAQDYMCEPSMIARTGLSVTDHQRLTIERYDALLTEDTAGIYVLPVLQGYAAADYVRHLRQYGERLTFGAWVGVGSICKRNGDASTIAEVLTAIKRERPDLRLHAFGLKTTALDSVLVRDSLETADSMAWSYAARRAGRNGNDHREAIAFTKRIETAQLQGYLFDPAGLA